ncbi:hypothetical protein GPROT2_02466 [Gammaproteobacteria bacterium]|nr:hypothetical protein GPROT2_02466 [Gammaproteobacteria bacterium]
MKTEADRVRRHTAQAVLRRIDDGTAARLLACAEDGPEAASRRLAELDREWDTDRVIETEAATTALIGLALGTFVDRRLLALPAVVASAVLLHALTGRYPLLPLLRRLGIRSSREIARERYALKALRGDFADLDGLPAHEAVQAAHAAHIEPGLH